jgi:hypothetical protein
MKILPLLCTVFFAFSLTARGVPGDISADDVTLDWANANTGIFDHVLHFGTGSGEGIGSKRNAGFGQYGLDFYTGFTNRMRILPSGGMSLGVTADPGAGKLQALGFVATPPANSNAQAFQTTQSLSGSIPPGDWAANDIQIVSDNADYGGNFGSALNIGHEFGGSSTKGGRNSLQVQTHLNAPTNSGNPNRNYVAGYFAVEAHSSDGGTNTLDYRFPGADARGGLAAINPFGIAHPGATNLLGVGGGEVDVAIESGASASVKSVLGLVYHYLDRVQGTVIDCALSISASVSSNPGARVGIEFSDISGWHPIAPNGTLIKATRTPGGIYAGNSAVPQIAHGIDLSEYQVNGDLIRGKYSELSETALVVGAGNYIGSTITVNGSSPNIDINMIPRGNGVIQVGNAGSYGGAPANPNTVVKWLKIRDNSGGYYYMPLYQ